MSSTVLLPASRARSLRSIVHASRPTVGTAALAALFGFGLLLATSAASEPTSLVPARKGGFPDWLHLPLSLLDLSFSRPLLLALLLGMSGAYLLSLGLSDAIRPRHAVTAIVGLHVVFLLGPPLLSTDVFNYIDYGRLGALHGLNPYKHGGSAAPGDPAYPFLGWREATTVYGPLFTLSSYAIAPLGVGGALWALKGATVAASLGTIGLVWKCAERLGISPTAAAMFVGLNPVLLVYGVGGVHNDLLMMLPVLAGVYLVVCGRELSGALYAVGGTAIKVSSALMLPFLFLGARARGRILLGILLGVSLWFVVALSVFRSGTVDLFSTLGALQRNGSFHSVPKAVGGLFGVEVTNGTLRLAASALFATSLAALVIRVWRGYDWLAAAGWATVALLATTTWLLPWYVVWALPLAALTTDRKLKAATLALTTFVLVMRIPSWLV